MIEDDEYSDDLHSGQLDGCRGMVIGLLLTFAIIGLVLIATSVYVQRHGLPWHHA